MTSATDSHEFTREKFDRKDYAAEYAGKFETSRKDSREHECLKAALAELPAGARVLDLPCGAGRMTTRLVRQGFRVTAADYSEHMLEQARLRVLPALEREGLSGRVEFSRQDIMKLDFPDDCFDAIACNRLFHHFSESSTRRRALAELRRVCKGPLVVSFFSTFALSALKRRIVDALRRHVPVDRVPIPEALFREDCEAVGLVVTQVLSVRWGVSPQTYLKLVRAS